MSRSRDSSQPAQTESFRSHLAQLDHWTFLVALVLVTANIVVRSPYLSATAAVLLFVALVYDAFEFFEW